MGCGIAGAEQAGVERASSRWGSGLGAQECWAGCWAAREVVAGPAGGRGEALGQAGFQAGLG